MGTATSGITPGTLVEQPHGGALRRGNPGNKAHLGLRRKVRARLLTIAKDEGAAYARAVLAEATTRIPQTERNDRRHREAMDALRWLGQYALGEPTPAPQQQQNQAVQFNVGMGVLEPGQTAGPHDRVIPV